MNSAPSRWEQGSDFHLLELPELGDPELPRGADLYASGRDAMRALIWHGISQHGWKVIWVPSYFCQTVLHDIRVGGIEIRVYPDGPLDPADRPISLESDEPGAVLTLNPFGLRTTSRPIQPLPDKLWVVEDHTHDPWSSVVVNSNADYALASLRKTIPIPDGGVLWSPKGLPLPLCPPPSQARNAASLTKLGGMTLKQLYLAGVSDDKNGARHMLVTGENGFGGYEISGMPSHTRGLLTHFPARLWREKRLQNFRRLSSTLETVPGISVFAPANGSAVPFSVVIRTDLPCQREDLRDRLLSSRIYPAILWSLDRPEVSGLRDLDIELSHTILSVHCDARYDLDDMDKVSDVIRAAMAEIVGGSK